MREEKKHWVEVTFDSGHEMSGAPGSHNYQKDHLFLCGTVSRAESWHFLPGILFF